MCGLRQIYFKPSLQARITCLAACSQDRRGRGSSAPTPYMLLRPVRSQDRCSHAPYGPATILPGAVGSHEPHGPATFIYSWKYYTGFYDLAYYNLQFVVRQFTVKGELRVARFLVNFFKRGPFLDACGFAPSPGSTPRYRC